MGRLQEDSSMMLLLLSGDVETNPGPPKSPAKRVKPPTEKEIMEGRVTNHDERLAVLEKLVKDQKVVVDEMTKTQVELKTALDDSKVEFERSVEENKVVSTSLAELKVKHERSSHEQVCLSTVPLQWKLCCDLNTDTDTFEPHRQSVHTYNDFPLYTCASH
jgi:hypothetical protein